MKTKGRSIVLFISIAIAAFVGLGLYVGVLISGESVYSNRGSLAYWLTISSVIKRVPEIQATSPSRFYASVGDGPKLPESAVSYHSSRDKSHVLGEIEAYLFAQGFHKRADGAYLRGDSVVSMEVSTESGGTFVTVRENR